MLELTDAQIGTWVATFLLPLFRVTAVLMTMPIFGTRMLPTRVRLYAAIAITVVIVPGLPPLPEFDPLESARLVAVRRAGHRRGVVRVDLADAVSGVRAGRANCRDPDGHGIRLDGRPREWCQRRGYPASSASMLVGVLAPVDERASGGVRGGDRKLHDLAGGQCAGGSAFLGKSSGA